MALYDMAGDYGGDNNYTDPSVRSANPYESNVRDWYQKYLGRGPENDQVVTNWAGMGAGAEQGIAQSDEAKAYASRAAAPSGGGSAPAGSIYDQIRAYQGSHPASEGIGGIAGALGLDRYMYGGTPSNNELMVGGQKYKVLGAEDSPNTAYWYTGGPDSGGGGGYGGGYSNQGIFDDPATAGWLKLLSARINALNQPYQPQDFGGLTDYLRSYMQKLQGPAYTPQQMDLLQTQSLDPLSQERDAARQRLLDTASRRGLNPQSGIIQKQLSDLDNQFEQIRTKTQAGFASKAVDLDRINAQQAASVGQLLANIEQTNFNQNEQRANQALGYAQQIPDLARQRMMDAQGILSQNSLNPTSLLQLSQQGDQFGSQQTQNYLLGLGQLLPYLLGNFGLGR